MATHRVAMRVDSHGLLGRLTGDAINTLGTVLDRYGIKDCHDEKS